MMRRGFTLVEMLIVIALTALLLSLLSPALARSREGARSLGCINNLRQTGMLHLDPLRDGDRWGLSAYDVPDSEGFTEPNHRVGGGDAPRRVGNESSIHNELIDIEWLEFQAPEMPDGWALVCPVAESMEMNSYGIYFRVVSQRHTSYSTSRDIILGGSDYKVVDIAQNFAFRHDHQSNFYYGDHHVASGDASQFSEEQWRQTSNRSDPHSGG